MIVAKSFLGGDITYKTSC